MRTRWVYALTLGALVGAMLVSGCKSGRTDTAGRLLRAGDFLQARHCYEQLVEEYPDDFTVRYGLAMSCCAEAMHRTELALALPKTWYPALYHMSVALNLSDNDQQVRRMMAVLHFNLGTAFRKAGNTDAALTRLTRALTYDPDLLKAINLLGVMYHEQENYERARYYYQRAVEIRPGYALGHFNLGTLAWLQRDYAGARDFIAQAAALDPDNTHFSSWLHKAEARVK